MSWRSAGVLWLVAFALAIAWWSGARSPSAPPAVEPSPAPRSPAYRVERGEIASVEVRRGAAVLRWSAGPGGWRIEEPAGARIPAGALEAFVDQIVEGARGERLDGAALDPAEVGLERPRLVVKVQRRSGAPLTLRLGDRVPTSTAVYAEVAESRTLFVAGLSFLTYADLLFRALR